MKRKHLLKLALMLAVPLALFAYVANLNSWRPRVIEMTGMSVGAVNDLMFSPNGRYLLATNASQEEVITDVVVCDVGARQAVRAIHHSGRPVFLGQGRSVAVWGDITAPEDARVLSFPDLRLLAKPPDFGPEQGFNAVWTEKAAWPNDETLATQYQRDKILLWNTRTRATGKIKLPLPSVAKGYYYRMEFLPDQKTVVTIKARSDGKSQLPYTNLQFWDVAKKKRRPGLMGQDGVSFFRSAIVTASPNGICAFRNSKGGLETWNYLSGQKQCEIRDSGYWATLSPDGAMLASVNGRFYNGNELDGDASRVTLWDARHGQSLRVIDCGGPTESLAFSPDGRTLAVGNYHGLVQLWRVK